MSEPHWNVQYSNHHTRLSYYFGYNWSIVWVRAIVPMISYSGQVGSPYSIVLVIEQSPLKRPSKILQRHIFPLKDAARD